MYVHFYVHELHQINSPIYKTRNIIKIFYNNSEDVGMAQKVEKQERDVTQ